MTIEMPVSLSLTEKRVIAHHLIEGKTQKETSKAVFISERAVRKTLESLKDKFGVDNSRQLFYFLTKNNLI